MLYLDSVCCPVPDLPRSMGVGNRCMTPLGKTRMLASLLHLLAEGMARLCLPFLTVRKCSEKKSEQKQFVPAAPFYTDTGRYLFAPTTRWSVKYFCG